jgi:hypothetical protein
VAPAADVAKMREVAKGEHQLSSCLQHGLYCYTGVVQVMHGLPTMCMVHACMRNVPVSANALAVTITSCKPVMPLPPRGCSVNKGNVGTAAEAAGAPTSCVIPLGINASHNL